ncbi:hypothetical protein [Nioella halotolerans]|uniref:hypothetical protein n=1 Tax=Nioella halotolerans TaxID=2303578 RepID=UPI003F65CEF3
MDAYADGDVQYALDEIAYATQLLNALVTEGLQAHLPEPQEGWTRRPARAWAFWAVATSRAANMPDLRQASRSR